MTPGGLIPAPTPADELLDRIGLASFSGVLSVVHEGQVLAELAGGLAKRERGEINRMETRFATASVSKMFTALCVARMTDAGLCRFDQPLGEVVPMLAPHFGGGFTLAALLSHRSGLGDYIEDADAMSFAGLDVARLESPCAFLPLVLRAPRFSPGEFRYSSAGYILLGLAIEALGGEPFPAALSRWVTVPAGLRDTGFPRLDAPSPGLATGYLPDGRPNFGHLPPVGGPDGGIVTSVADLRRLFDGLRRGDLVSQSAREFLFREASRISEEEGYGHGFYITREGGLAWHGHTGSDPGVSAQVAFSLRTESSVIVLCNVQEQAFRVFRLALEWLGEQHCG